MRLCDIEGCGRKHNGKGLCLMHFKRKQRNGHPETRQRLRGVPAEERFWSYVDATGPCWEWTRYKDVKGYGSFGVTSREVWRAHRYAWTILVGPIPDGLHIDHLCTNKLCVNPDHMELTTAKINSERRWSRLRD